VVALGDQAGVVAAVVEDRALDGQHAENVAVGLAHGFHSEIKRRYNPSSSDNRNMSQCVRQDATQK
jgi:hypothetical protein